MSPPRSMYPVNTPSETHMRPVSVAGSCLITDQYEHAGPQHLAGRLVGSVAGVGGRQPVQERHGQRDTVGCQCRLDRCEVPPATR